MATKTLIVKSKKRNTRCSRRAAPSIGAVGINNIYEEVNKEDKDKAYREVEKALARCDRHSAPSSQNPETK